MIGQLSSQNGSIRYIVVLLQRVENDGDHQANAVQKVCNRNVHVMLRANWVRCDVLSEGGHQNNNASKDWPHNFHERDEDPEGPVVTDVLVLLVVENQCEHYLEEASVEHDRNDVMDG